MGFPSGYTSLLPKLLLTLLSLLGLIRTLILTTLGLLGLSDFLEPEISWPNNPNPTPSTRPASTLIREMLPVAKFSEAADQPERCAVCLYDFEDAEEIRRLRNCRHIFHRDCLDRWMDHAQSTCPLCRTSFVPQEMQREFNDRLWADVYGECFPIF